MRKTHTPNPSSSPQSFLNFVYELAEREGKVGEAIRLLSSALDHLSGEYLGYAYNGLSIYYSRLGDLDTAIKWAKRAADEFDAPESYFYLASFYARKYDLDGACHYARQYLEREPNGEFSEQARELIEVLGGQREELKRLYPSLTDQQIDRVLEIKAAASDMAKLGQTAEAIELLNEALTLTPADTSLRNNLTVALVFAGRYEEAAREAEASLSYDPQNLHALCNLARIHHVLGNGKKARTFADRAKRCDPKEYCAGFEKLSECLTALEDHQGIHQMCRSQLQENPQDWKATFMLAVAEANLGNYKEARRIFSAARELRPDLVKVVDYRLQELDSMIAAGTHRQPMEYEITLNDTIRARLEPEEFGAVARLNPAIKGSVMLALREPSASESTKEAALEALGAIGGDDVESFLRAFIKEPQESDDIKMKAIWTLKEIGAQPPFQVHFQGELTELEVFRTPLPHDASLKAQEVAQMIIQIGAKLSSLEYRQRSDLIEFASEIWAEHVEWADPEIEDATNWAVACLALAADESNLSEKFFDEVFRCGGRASRAQREIIYDLMDELDGTLQDLYESPDDEGETAEEALRDALAVLDEYDAKSFDELVEIGLQDPEAIARFIPIFGGKAIELCDQGQADHVIASVEELIQEAENWQPEADDQETRPFILEFLFDLLARVHQKSDEGGKAIEVLMKGLNVIDSALLWTELGHLLLGEGRSEEAIQCWQTAVAREPQDPDMILEIAAHCLEHGLTGAAEDFIRDALESGKLEYAQMELMYMLVEVHETRGDYKRAEEMMDQILEEEVTEDVELVIWTKCAVERNRKIEALDRLKYLAEGFDEEELAPIANLLLALLYLELGKEKKVVQRLKAWRDSVEEYEEEGQLTLLEDYFSEDEVSPLRQLLARL